MWLMDDSLARPTSNLFPIRNNTISIGYGPVIQPGLKIIFFLLSDMMSLVDVFHAGCTSFMLDIFTLPLAKS